jgi:hypothetical protein
MLGSIAVYGKNDSQSLLNTYAGNISFDLAFGNPAESPIYYLPFAALTSVAHGNLSKLSYLAVIAEVKV